MFEFSNEIFPLNAISNLIKQKQTPIIETMVEKHRTSLQHEIHQLLKTKNYFSMEELQSTLGLVGKTETQKILNSLWDSCQIDKFLVQIQPDLFIAREKVDAWLAKIQEVFQNHHVDSLSKSALHKALPTEFPHKWLDDLLRTGNYRIAYINLSDVKVIQP
jgi:hypothetical protein